MPFALCAQKASNCAQMSCPSSISEVCGNDGVTYSNACELRRATCASGVQLSHRGPCTDLTKDEECPIDCDGVEEKMVCGSDGNAYK